MLFEDDGCGERGLHAMGCLVLHHAAKAAQGWPVRRGLVVIGQRVEKPLNLPGGSEAADESTLSSVHVERRRDASAVHR